MIAGMAETASDMHAVNFAIYISILIPLIIIFTVAYILVQIVSLWYNILQLNENACVHLMNLDCAYVTIVLLGLQDDVTSLLLGDQSQKCRYLCMSGQHIIWSKVSRCTHLIKTDITLLI